MAPQSCLDDGLRRHVGAQAHVRQHVQAQDEVLRTVLLAGQYHPADAIAGDHVRLRKAREGDAEQVGGKACNGNVLKVVHNQAIVNFVGKDHQLMLAGNIDDLLQHFARIQRAGGVVGVDDDDGLRARRDLALDIVDIGIPFSLLVANVVNGRTAGKGGAGRP